MDLQKPARHGAAPPRQGQTVVATDREFTEAIARCIAVMVYYQNEKRSPRARPTMNAEVQTIAEWALSLSLSPGELDRDLFNRVKEELVARYGRLTGNRLGEEFIIAFECTGGELHSSQRSDDSRLA